mgnify:CR=1 FL=1
MISANYFGIENREKSVIDNVEAAIRRLEKTVEPKN